MHNTIKILIIVFFSIFWVLLIPGYVAYKDHVFTGRDFKNRINDSVIQSRLTDIGGAEKFYKNGKAFVYQNDKIQKVSFSGFIDNQLNYIWLTTYTFFAIFIFIFYRGWFKPGQIVPLSLIVLIILLLFDGPNWFRNTDLGKHGRTIYSYVNYDIDPFSYWLQELRALTFSFLLGATLTIGEEIKKENILFIKSFNGEPTLETFVDFSLKLRDNFSKWQRNIFIIIVIFLPWTWFYWENITIYNDARYLFAAILFHSFWVISICLFSSPIISFRSHWWKMKTQIILKYLKNDQPDQIAQFEYLEPYPKFQFLVSAFTALVSLFLPFVQIFFKK